MSRQFLNVSVSLSLVLSLFFSVNAVADENHYKNLLIGERPAGMAGAYTAVSDSPEGAFYNPAGLVYSVGKSLSVSVNAYNNSRTTYDGVVGGSDWTRNSSTLVPNYFGIVQPWGKGKIAFSYAVPDVVEEDQNQEFTNFSTSSGSIKSFNINLSEVDKTYKFGPSYAQKINDSLSIGGTLYIHYRQVKRIVNQYVYYQTSNYEWNNLNYKSTEYGIEPKLGVMWSPADKISLGLTLSKNTIFSSHSREQSTENKSATPTKNETVVRTSDDDRKFPLTASLGAAWFASESFLLTCDFDYFAEVSSENRASVVNFALGSEYYSSEEYAWRAGFYTNMANTPEVDSGGMNQQDNIDLYGITASVTRFTRSSAMTFGVNYASGSGDAQPISNSTSIFDASTESFTMYVSGSFSY